jgi:outer membrane protein OmpA-like peptidoglycan-associated protein
MRKIRGFLIAIFILSSSSTFAQETVLWASEVMYATSESGPLQYSAIQALHKPNVYPKSGASPNAWRPKKPNKDDYIVVKFDRGIHAQQIAIAETENPGAVSKIYAYDAQDNEYLLFDFEPRKIPLPNRLLNLFFEKTPYEIAYIRVDISGGAVEGYNAIDAIGISESNIPINVLITLTQNVATDLHVEKLGPEVNSSYTEHSPLLSPDGNTLFFSRQYHPDNIGGVDDNEDIWYSEKDPNTGKWLPAKNLGPPLNNKGPNFIASITQDGDDLVLLLGNQYGKKGRMQAGVSMSRKKPGGEFEKPINLIIANDYNYSNKADYYMSDDGNIILISAERDDTYGDRDLYVSFKDRRGEWSEPINLGSTINSADTESSPFLDHDNETLYFSSSGFSGYGGADIYVSKRLDDSWQNWSVPENLGPGINGESDDVYFNIPSNGSHAYFTKGNIGENIDIFQFQMDQFFLEERPKRQKDDKEEKESFITVSGKVINQKTNEPVGTKVIIERLPDGKEIGHVESDPETGEYEFSLKMGARYGFLAEADDFLSVNQNIDLENVQDSSEINQELALVPIESGASIVMNNIFFDFDKSELKTGSYPELKRILKLLKNNKINKIEISGHTDSKGDDTYNLGLSNRRAKAVYNYFKSNNIAESRLVSVGYGESQPVATNDTAEGRKRNRRVEFKILD